MVEAGDRCDKIYILQGSVWLSCKKNELKGTEIR